MGIPVTTGKKTTQHNPEDCTVPDCAKCKLKIPFELPQEIVSAYKEGNLVIFAGSGVSTESSGIFPLTFYQEIKAELNIPQEEKIKFSELMTLYSSTPRTRKDLLQAIKKRIDYVKSFPELYRSATEFHRELSTIPHLDEIFTTNWDDFFERECYATPIVTGRDFAVIHDVSGRKVFKLHGSIYNFGSIVASKKDYQNCYRRLSKGIIGAKLKLLLMSKTLLFFGFSFEDEDFQRLYRLLKKDVGGLIPQLYVITLNKLAKEKLSSLNINATPIITSAAFFIQKFKEKLVEEKLMLPDNIYDGIEEALDNVLIEHQITTLHYLDNHVDSVYSLWYQDGLQHAFERIIATKSSGEYSCVHRVINIVDYYEDRVKKELHEGRYHDVAYFTGYKNGLIFLLYHEEDRKSLPMYFLFKCDDIVNFNQYIELEKDAAKRHKAAHKFAEKHSVNISKGLVQHHTPF